DGGEEGGTGQARQRERRRPSGGPRAPAEHVGGDNRDRRADERRGWQQVPAPRREGDDERRTEPSAGRSTEEVGVRERVAEDALVCRSRGREGTPDEGAQDHARQP